MKVEKEFRAGPDLMLSYSKTGQEMAFSGEGNSKRQRSPKYTSAYLPYNRERQQRTGRGSKKTPPYSKFIRF